ncbi:MAG: TraX family protein [Lachnospiraceae bacterium]
MLNRDTIKYLAILAMLLNHIANLFLAPGTLLCEIFLDIGYFTAITMCYFLVEGFHFTHSKRKYGQRLLLSPFSHRVPFMLAFHTPTGNMLLTLFLCFLILICMERLPFASVRCRIEIAGLVLLSCFCDWAGFAALFTVLFAQAGQDRKRIGKVSSSWLCSLCLCKYARVSRAVFPVSGSAAPVLSPALGSCAPAY